MARSAKKRRSRSRSRSRRKYTYVKVGGKAHHVYKSRQKRRKGRCAKRKSQPICISNPNCLWTGKRCKSSRRRAIYAGPSLPTY